MSNKKEEGHLNMADLGSALPTTATALSAEDRAGLVSALKNKLQNLAHSDVIENLSPSVRKRVEVLREIQDLRLVMDDCFQSSVKDEILDRGCMSVVNLLEFEGNLPPSCMQCPVWANLLKPKREMNTKLVQDMNRLLDLLTLEQNRVWEAS